MEDSQLIAHRLAISGISGRTGHELARVACTKGWEVYGLVRPTSEGEGAIIHGRIVRGHFEDFDRVVETVADSQAVCCLIGPRPPYTDVFCVKATTAIIAAMKQTGCTRLVCQTGAMIGPAPNRSHPMEWMARTFARWHPAAIRDREEQECLVESSGLDWTIVKPPRLTDSAPRGRVQAGPYLRVGLLSRISRADLAAFILDEIQTGRFVRQRIFVKGYRFT
ncbi:MAG: NAD(P)H-binding protein [Nitrospira sp.]|nr:NAD(P)H-binding protein [Nitrospira sp.]